MGQGYCYKCVPQGCGSLIQCHPLLYITHYDFGLATNTGAVQVVIRTTWGRVRSYFRLVAFSLVQAQSIHHHLFVCLNVGTKLIATVIQHQPMSYLTPAHDVSLRDYSSSRNYLGCTRQYSLCWQLKNYRAFAEYTTVDVILRSTILEALASLKYRVSRILNSTHGLVVKISCFFI
jgi:hypothetical protein